MSDSRQGIGVLLVTAGSYLLYCSVTNQAPVKTLQAIIKDPSHARSILAARQNSLDDSIANVAGGLQDAGAAVATGIGKGASNLVDGVKNARGGPGMVIFATAMIGQPYVFGGHARGGWDCSGLVMEALKYAYGINVPHSATAQLLDPRGKKVAKADLQVGDLVFPNLPPLAGDHVQIYAGDGKIIEAARPGTNVRQVPMWGFYTARRYGG